MMMAELVVWGALWPTRTKRFTVLSEQGWDFPSRVALGRMVDVGSHPEIFWCWNWRQVALSMRCAGAEPVGGQYAGRRHFSD